MTTEERADRDAVWRMLNAFQVSQALHVAATLGIADLLAAGPRPVEALAEASATHAASLQRHSPTATQFSLPEAIAA